MYKDSLRTERVKCFVEDSQLGQTFLLYVLWAKIGMMQCLDLE